MLPRHHQPIVAIATAAGRGAVGIVRASGRHLQPLIDAVCGQPLKPRHASYLPFADAQGQAIDQGLAIHFPGPHSYTGEDVLELQAHGGPVVLQLLLARCLEAGAGIGLRLAEPGEFTERAYLNDKLDLAQAEAVSDLIEASTEAAARSASRSLTGVFSAQIDGLRERLVTLRMLVEATLDFPEEDIDFLQKADARGQLDAIAAQVAAVLDRARQGALLREGIQVVLAGQPNVGKSSLLNALHPTLALRTQEISESVNKGRHTTVGAKLIPLPDGDGGFLVDTPGLREVGMWGLPSESLDQCFPEFRPMLGECRFQDCKHDSEPECAVIAGVRSGALDRGRYDSYLKLLGELQVSERVR